MIAVQLQGGLGNQLFEYATAKALAAKTGQRPFLDTSLLETKNAHRPFFIKAFPLQATYPSNRLQRWYFHRFQKPYLVDTGKTRLFSGKLRQNSCRKLISLSSRLRRWAMKKMVCVLGCMCGAVILSVIRNMRFATASIICEQ